MKNSGGQLGVIGEELVFEPKIMDVAPWHLSTETQIIFGKNSRGYVFQCRNKIRNNLIFLNFIS